MNTAGMTISDARFARTTPDAVALRDGPLTLMRRQADARVAHDVTARVKMGT
jgi:hypothetical protein